ncbi:hypothetical protein DAKH74_013990 [Maudiozyma humilis]|uniref:Uncharacterized protein n=1 Tax=Maudiozyma humilis TaxID=51915 RepID=A0AAV5RTM7_MAUHU|nr:hypothetical protein DAKH74_013990 [Kazachstania humilis]
MSTASTQGISSKEIEIWYTNKSGNQSDLPMIQINIPNHSFTGLVDCGSRINTMQETQARIFQETQGIQCTRQHTTRQIKCAGKLRESTYNLEIRGFEISGTKFRAEFYILPDADDIPKIILGLPWLDQYNILLSFSKEQRLLTDSQGNTVTLGKQTNGPEDNNDIHTLTYESYYTQLATEVAEQLDTTDYDYQSAEKTKDGDKEESNIPDDLQDVGRIFDQPNYNNKAKDARFHTFIEFENEKPHQLSSKGYPVPMVMKE